MEVFYIWPCSKNCAQDHPNSTISTSSEHSAQSTAINPTALPSPPILHHSLSKSTPKPIGNSTSYALNHIRLMTKERSLGAPRCSSKNQWISVGGTLIMSKNTTTINISRGTSILSLLWSSKHQKESQEKKASKSSRRNLYTASKISINFSSRSNSQTQTSTKTNASPSNRKNRSSNHSSPKISKLSQLFWKVANPFILIRRISWANSYSLYHRIRWVS